MAWHGMGRGLFGPVRADVTHLPYLPVAASTGTAYR
ncbi:predicted protein [Plenodomus lingam JN3]|uniref:Predicted protein n=1 Tax=Leptosphaeria maculans (strain JN3 / isolate v23.1.3 / race Av1-4-5-6-7-8) TaxID=985895 RepID=E5A894_LEPMJ|nr:predicted protein [Plenodomus lingam JN3]CBX99839.1 predicted protein [Plenodomus lingam JN3]